MRRFVFLSAVALLFAALLAAASALRPRLAPAERGRRLAETNGCFSCHGPEGTKGIANPGRTDRTVPSFGAIMMYAEDRDQVRAWIRDGETKARAASRRWRAERERGALRMPAYGRRLTGREIEDLVEFALAAAGEPTPDDSLAFAGMQRAAELGCFGCHGAGARFARPNPGSFKGYVPSWSGPDFAELVRDRAEFGEWVAKGVGRRFEDNPVAMKFLRRAALRMPAYDAHLRPGDLSAMWAYVTWLRGLPAITPMGP
jgi:mono/diheme cytochrome c family protein